MAGTPSGCEQMTLPAPCTHEPGAYSHSSRLKSWILDNFGDAEILNLEYWRKPWTLEKLNLEAWSLSWIGFRRIAGPPTVARFMKPSKFQKTLEIHKQTQKQQDFPAQGGPRIEIPKSRVNSKKTNKQNKIFQPKGVPWPTFQKNSENFKTNKKTYFPGQGPDIPKKKLDMHKKQKMIFQAKGVPGPKVPFTNRNF